MSSCDLQLFLLVVIHSLFELCSQFVQLCPGLTGQLVELNLVVVLHSLK